MPSSPVLRSAGPKDDAALAHGIRWDERIAKAPAMAAVPAVDDAAQQPTTGAWTTAFQSGRPLTGLAHGASGIGLALIEAGVALDDDELVDAGARDLRYEAEVFDEEAGNWPDFRDTVTFPSFMLGWCAGAPGIGLARVQALTSAPAHTDGLMKGLSVFNVLMGQRGT
jgi:lantibiotic modifying enzyme